MGSLNDILGDQSQTRAQQTPQIEKINPVAVTAPATVQKPQVIRDPRPYDWVDSVFASVKRPMSPEEVEAQRKREKRSALFSAIGDGISALSNLVATSAGAPSAYNPAMSMSAANQAAWDRIRARQKEDDDAWYKAVDRLTRAQEYKDARAYRNKELEMQNKRYDLSMQEYLERRKQQEIENDYKERTLAFSKDREEADNKLRSRGYDLEEKKLNLATKQYNNSKKEDITPFPLNNKTQLLLPNSSYNDIAILSSIFKNLKPEQQREFMEPILDKLSGRETGRYNNPTVEQMKAAIGKYVQEEGNERALAGLYALAGQEFDYGPYEKKEKEQEDFRKKFPYIAR